MDAVAYARAFSKAASEEEQAGTLQSTEEEEGIKKHSAQFATSETV